MYINRGDVYCFFEVGGIWDSVLVSGGSKDG